MAPVGEKDAAIGPAHIAYVLELAYAELTGEPPEIALSARLADDLGLNSLQRYELLIALEEEWDIELVDSIEIVSAQTVSGLVELIAAMLAQR